MTDIRELNAEALEYHLDDLCRVLIDSVSDGAAISFMAPLGKQEAEQFWMSDVKLSVERGDKRLFGAFAENTLLGTVQLIIAMPPNQPHRAEVSKMIVHPDARRQGFGKALMKAALDEARQAGKTLITLDTRTGDVSENLYRGVGFEQAGMIPDFALDPDGEARHSTTYMFRYL